MKFSSILFDLLSSSAQDIKAGDIIGRRSGQMRPSPSPSNISLLIIVDLSAATNVDRHVLLSRCLARRQNNRIRQWNKLTMEGSTGTDSLLISPYQRTRKRDGYCLCFIPPHPLVFRSNNTGSISQDIDCILDQEF